MARKEIFGTDFAKDAFKTKINDNFVELYGLTEEIYYDGKKIKITNPYKNGGNLSLKGQLHSHTTNSDGVNSPIDLVTAYRNAGYDFIAITDHDFITPDPSVSGIIFMQGVEETNSRHIVAYDITEQSTSTDSQTVINFHKANSKICSIAHPNWANTLIGKPEMQAYYDYNFTEVFNGTTNTIAEEHWDWVLSTRKKIFALAVDDCHNIADSYQFNAGYVVVKADTKNKASILQSLKNGNFYSSTGNDINISVNERTLTASSTQLSNFTFIGSNGRILQQTNNVLSVNYAIKGDELYVRVVSVKVSNAQMAWSQPVFIESVGIYEEGYWTPIIAGEPVAGNHTYSKQYGRYARVGNVVTLEFDVQLSLKDTAINGGWNLFIKGMPFISQNPHTVIAPLWYSGVDLGAGYIGAQYVYGTQNQYATLYRMHQSAPAFFSPDIITDTTRFIGTITYIL